MQKAYLIFFFIICQIIGFKAYAQNSIHGTVVDSTGNPLPYVNIRLVTNEDTLLASSDAKGQYRIDNIKEKFIFLSYSLLGFKVETYSHYFLESQRVVQLPLITMKTFNQSLPVVDVAYVIPMQINGDTTQFNFGAYDFRKTALLEEALKDLPGFQVYRDGSISFNGKQIRRVRVDNKDFFGGDLLTATRNLPADFVKNIQLFNSTAFKEENTGIMRLDDEKVLNITLKEDKKTILFGQVTGGVGSNDRYVGSFGLNKFDKGQELSVLGSFNNTNTNIFTFGNPSGGDRVKSALDLEGFSDPIDGMNKVGSVGINISDQLSKNISFNASYNYLYQNNLIDGNSLLTSTYTDNIINRKEEYQINTLDLNHRIKFGLDMKFNNNDVFKVQGNFSYNQQKIEQIKEVMLKSTKSKAEGSYQDSSRRTSPSGDFEFLYSKFFKKKGRKFIANLVLNSNKQNRYEFVDERYLEHNLLNLDDYTDIFNQNQYIMYRNHASASKARITFVEPFSAHSLFEFSYELEATSINSLRLVEDQLSSDLSRFIDSLTVDYEYQFKSHRGSITYQYEPNSKFKMNFGFAVQPLLMEGFLPRKETEYKYDNVNLIPSANFIYKFSKEMDWQLSYKGKNNQPYFTQIAPVIDNSNSRNVIIGNPELKAEYAHRISTTFRKTRGSKMQYFETNLAYSFIMDKIVSDKQTYPKTTIQETTFKNTSGYYDWRWYYTFSTPFIIDDIILDLTGTTDYYNNISFIGGSKRTTKQTLINQAVQFKYSWSDYFESTLNGNYQLNKAKYDIPYKTEINIGTVLLGLGAKGYLNDNWALGLEMSQRFNDGYKNTVLNVNQTMMNSFIEFTFLKSKSALLRLQGYDLFDQNKNSGIISEYIGNDVYEARNNRLGRYFMLSLNIRLQKIPKSK